MKLRTALFAFPLTIAAGLYFGHITASTATNTPPPLPAYVDTDCITDAECGLTMLTHATEAPEDTLPKGHHIDFWEDGSGVRYDAHWNEVATYPEGTFHWDCTTMGNRICG